MAMVFADYSSNPMANYAYSPLAGLRQEAASVFTTVSEPMPGAAQTLSGGSNRTLEGIGNVLSDVGYIASGGLSNAPGASAEAVTAEQGQSFLRRYSLKIAGWLNLIGDVGFLANGINNGDPYKIIGGTLYTGGALNLATYGDVGKERLMRNFTEKLAELVKQQGAELPENTGLAEILKNKRTDLMGKLDRFLGSQPAQNTMGAYTLGAGALLLSGIQKHQRGEGSAGMYYGISSLVFKLGSFLIPESAKSAEGEKTIQKDGLFAWLKEKPLRLFGYGSLVTDSLLAWDAYQEYKHNPEKGGYMWTALTSVTYILADLFMAVSHKDPSNAQGKFTADEQQRIEQLAAEAIASQRPEKQEALAETVTNYLASQSEMGKDREHLKRSLRDRVEKMTGAMWSERSATEGELATQR